VNNGCRGMHASHHGHTGPNHVGRGQKSLHRHRHAAHRSHWPLELLLTMGRDAVIKRNPAIVTGLGLSFDKTGRKIIAGRRRVVA
jgi:hypothetical protein